MKFLSTPGYKQENIGRRAIYFAILIITSYYGFLAESRYTSESKIVVRRSTDSLSQLGGISLPFLGAIGGSSAEDAYQLREYINSNDMLEVLDNELGLQEHLRHFHLDIFNTLLPWEKKEKFLKIFRKSIEISFEEKTGILTISAHGNSPDFAYRLNYAIIKESERFINDQTHRVSREQLEFANSELLRARKAMDDAKDGLIAYQNNKGLIDPLASAQSTFVIIAGLESQLANKEVELKTLSRVMQSNSDQIIAIQKSITVIKNQINHEKSRLTAPDESSLNRISANYLERKGLVDFYSDVYKISLAATEKLRVETARKIKTISIISSPYLPEQSDFMHKIYMWASWLFIIIITYGAFKLTVEIIEDHRD